MLPIDWCKYDCYAFAFVDPAVPNPRAILRAALYSKQIHNGDLIQIRPSSMGAKVAVFSQVSNRNVAINTEPVRVMEYFLHFEWPEDTDNHFTFEHSGYATISLEDFPIKHWSRSRVVVATGVMANPLNVQQLSITGVDFTTTILTTRYESYLNFPNTLH